jgi:hypothetical protein
LSSLDQFRITGSYRQEEQLTRDVTRTFEGITCTWPANLSEGAAICRLANGDGLATVLAKRLVMVRNFRSRKVVFTRNQPEHSSAYGRSSDKRVTHQETHQGITCYWSGVGGGAAFCNRADEPATQPRSVLSQHLC